MSGTRADCTVRALAAASGLVYEHADLIATAAGRRQGRGFNPAWVLAEAKKRGVLFHKLRFTRRRTLARFINEYPKGRYYVRMRRHCFAVIDGVPSEPQPLGVLINTAWKFVSNRSALI